jgi:hypothetical protein
VLRTPSPSPSESYAGIAAAVAPASLSASLGLVANPASVVRQRARQLQESLLDSPGVTVKNLPERLVLAGRPVTGGQGSYAGPTSEPLEEAAGLGALFGAGAGDDGGL